MAHEKIVTAFNQVQQAEVAKEKLIAEGIAEKHIDIISGERLRVEGKEIRHPSFWQRLFGDDVDDDYATEYNKAIQGGGVLLTVRAPKEDADRVEALLDQYSTDYSASYNRSGLADTTGANREHLGETNDLTGRTTSAGFAAGATGVTGNNNPTSGVPGTLDDKNSSKTDLANDASTSGIVTGTGTGATGHAATGIAGTTGAALTGSEDRDALKLAEEEVAIGKRQVSDGVVRLRRYTVEDEVAEDVSLFEQHADVFRHAVDEPAYLSDVDWSDKTIEVEESHEVPTVSKTARIKEEVGVRNETSERVETVKDTVRRQEVEVEQSGANDLAKDPLTGTTTGLEKDNLTGTHTGLEKDNLTGTGSDLDKDRLTGLKK